MYVDPCALDPHIHVCRHDLKSYNLLVINMIFFEVCTGHTELFNRCLPPMWLGIWELNCGKLRHAHKVHRVRGIPDYTSQVNVDGRMF